MDRPTSLPALDIDEEMKRRGYTSLSQIASDLEITVEKLSDHLTSNLLSEDTRWEFALYFGKDPFTGEDTGDPEEYIKFSCGERIIETLKEEIGKLRKRRKKLQTSDYTIEELAKMAGPYARDLYWRLSISGRLRRRAAQFRNQILQPAQSQSTQPQPVQIN
jgi:hypothetical protein